MVYQKARNKEGAALNAQNSANDNVTAAQNLNANPDNNKRANDDDQFLFPNFLINRTCE